MNMKDHILAALREQFDRWEELLASKSTEQITAPQLPSNWSIQDVIAHVGTWRERSIARFEAARFNREPQFPPWLPGVDPDLEAATDQVNAWIYDTHHRQPWPSVHQDWVDGFRRLVELAEAIPEKDLLDESKYPWMNGYPLALVLVASYDHHQEHLDQLLAWLHQTKIG